MFSIKQIVITAALLTVSAPAFAGSLVTNSTSTRNTVGRGETHFTSTRNESGTQNNFSQSVKAESYAPHAAASVTLKDGKLSGTATGSTSPINPDPIAILVNSSQNETLTFTQSDKSSGTEKYTFTGNEYSHRVDANNF